MRFIIMHKTDARWEAGEIPSAALIARVGALLGELSKENVLLAGEGLRASSHGVRLRFAGGERTITKGPFTGENELPARFSILRAESLDDAIRWASAQAAVLGDVEIDIRPVNEPWDIGMMPKPAGMTAVRFMALVKATAESEAGVAPTPEQEAKLARLTSETQHNVVPLASETLRPSARGRRYKNTSSGVRIIDGPFTESKELIAGYMIIAAQSLEDAARWAIPYLESVETEEVDVRELC